MPRETSSRSCSVIEGCLPTWESGPVATTEAVAPILYTLSLTNRLGGCLVTLWSWGAHRSSAHTPVSRSSSLPIFQSDGFALLHNLCWRAGVLRPLWWTQGYWTKQRAQWYTTHTPSPGELNRFCLSSLDSAQTETKKRHSS